MSKTIKEKKKTVNKVYFMKEKPTQGPLAFDPYDHNIKVVEGEAQKELPSNGRICPKCKTVNPKGKVTCKKCGGKLYSKLNGIKAKKASVQDELKAKKESPPHYSHKDSVADAILSFDKKPFTMGQLKDAITKLYVNHGGVLTDKENSRYITRILPVLIRLGVVQVSGEGDAMAYIFTGK